MQTLELIQNEVKNRESFVKHLINQLEVSDAKSKVAIENKLVEIGKDAVKLLVNNLLIKTGQVQGVIAMALIRIGKDSVSELQKISVINSQASWICGYLISEIICEEKRKVA